MFFPSVVQRDGEWGCDHHTLLLSLLHPQEHPFSRVGSLPQKTFLLLHCKSFLQSAVAYGLLQCWSLSQSAALQEQAPLIGATCSYRTPQQALSANLLWNGLFSAQGHSSWQEPIPACTSQGIPASFGHINLLPPGPPWAPLQWDSVTHHGLCVGLLWHLQHLSFSFCLVSAELFLSHILTCVISDLNYFLITFFLSYKLCQKCYYHCLSEVGPSWTWLVMALMST